MTETSVEEGRYSTSLTEVAARFPIPRVGKPQEIAAACAYFASEDAGYTTGQLLGINGGTFM